MYYILYNINRVFSTNFYIKGFFKTLLQYTIGAIYSLYFLSKKIDILDLLKYNRIFWK